MGGHGHEDLSAPDDELAAMSGEDTRVPAVRGNEGGAMLVELDHLAARQPLQEVVGVKPLEFTGSGQAEEHLITQSHILDVLVVDKNSRLI